MLDKKEVTQQELDKIHEEVNEEIVKAFQFAEESDPDDVENMLRGVYDNFATNQ